MVPDGAQRAEDPSRSPVAIAHDYLTQRGGAERVVLALLDAFPGAPVLTSFYNPETTFPEFRRHDVRPSPLQRVPALRHDPRRALPLLPRVWGSMVADADVVICSSTGFAHGVRATGKKVVYCHNPPRWLYQPEDYLLDQPRPVRLLFRALRGPLHRWDTRAAASADLYVANSTSVAERVLSAYGRDAAVIHPPVNLSADGPSRPVAGLDAGFFLTVGRSRGYKNTRVAVDAVRRVPGARLVVVGAGRPTESEDGITYLGVVEDAELRWLYAHARALVATSFEDFGLTPVEAASFGTPTVALRRGGYLDSIVHGRTGLLVEDLTAEAFAATLTSSALQGIDPAEVLAHAERFTPARFVAQLQQQVAGL